jgi:hypothetical protein
MTRAISLGTAVAGALGAVAFSLIGTGPASAQFFNPLEALFGPPPRPPSTVPSARPQAYPGQAYPGYEQRYQDYPGSQGSTRQGPGGGVSSEPLPPPGGGPTASVDPDGRPLPPGVRPPRGTPQPADTSPQPGDEVMPEPPVQKIPNKGALFSGLDKITGRIINFDVEIGETVQFGALQVTPRACYTRPATETANTDAFIEVDEVTLQGEVKRIFTGWMFAASPGLHAVEHPIYDVWLTDCKAPLVASATQVETPPAAEQAAAKPAAPKKPPRQSTSSPQSAPQANIPRR